MSWCNSVEIGAVERDNHFKYLVIRIIYKPTEGVSNKSKTGKVKCLLVF